MKEKELINIILAIILLSLIISMDRLLNFDFFYLGTGLLFAFIIISIYVSSRKLMASWLDASVEHHLWKIRRYGFAPKRHFKRPFQASIIPLVVSIITAGFLKPMTLLMFETSALKRRAAKRHGYYSYTEMTDFHTALIGASGIVSVLILSLISYWIPALEELARMSAFFALWNLIPISKLDGSQIYFGSRVIWTALSIIALSFATFAILMGII